MFKNTPSTSEWHLESGNGSGTRGERECGPSAHLQAQLGNSSTSALTCFEVFVTVFINFDMDVYIGHFLVFICI